MSSHLGETPQSSPNGSDSHADSGRALGNTGSARHTRQTSVEGAELSDDLSDDDDGLFYEGTSDIDGNSDNEELGEEEDTAAAGDQVYSWRIDHSSGDHKLRPTNFIERVESNGFDGAQAFEMLHRLHTIDYGSRQAGSKAVDPTDEFRPVFFLDYICIVGRPLRPLTRVDGRFFDNVTITFKNWHVSYAAKHQYKIPFELRHRTFRIATASTREKWYIVMHPIVNPVTELPSSRRARLQKQAESSRSSALRIHHAQALVSYIKSLFLSGELLGERIEPSWNLNSPLDQVLAGTKWTTFQQAFVENWAEHVERYSHDSFWTENEPVFHAYEHGANIEIEVKHGVKSLHKETRLRPVDDSEDTSEDDLAAGVAEILEDGIGDSSDEGPFTQSQHSSQDVDGDAVIESASSSPDRDGWQLGSESSPDSLYSDDLKKLATELDHKYDLENISSLSYALAVNLHCLESASTGAGKKAALCLLADRNAVRREYGSSRGASGMTFYPMAFHPAYGNFTSPGPPRFLNDNVFAVMKDNMSFQNDGADVLSCNYFQAYTNLKRTIRHNPEDLLVTQGIATAALTLPASEAQGSARTKAKQERLLRKLQGSSTPGDPEASRPFARERQRIRRAIAGEDFAYRMEQVICFDVARLVPSRRNVRTILQPIFQLMRFYLQETQHYAKLLRSFRPTVFPQILGSFARMFDLAIGEMLKRFRAQGSRGLGLALSEGVAALDRLGHYCFTGTPMVLMSSVFGPLKTMESLQKGGWPYIDPQLLDLRYGEGSLDIIQWPRTRNGRPLFMHTASLGFHYSPEVAASRHSLIWFRDLGGKLINGPAGATRFLEEVFRDLWMPQMIAYISHQLRQQLGLNNTHDDDMSPDEVKVKQQQRALLDGWLKCASPFSWSVYQPIWTLAGPDATRSASTYKSRRDFADEIYEHCIKDDKAGHQALSSLHSTWFAVLHAVLTFTPGDRVTKEQWLGGLTAAMISNRIECMPGSHRSRITYRRVVRLVGASPPLRAIAARPGSLKREAIEAEHRAQQPVRRRAIDLGCEIPFVRIPDIVEEGFKALSKMFSKGNPRILEHYHIARNCLESCLGDPLCDVLLILVLTFSLCSVTPSVPVGGGGFEVGPRKDTAQFAANLKTFMLVRIMIQYAEIVQAPIQSRPGRVVL